MDPRAMAAAKIDEAAAIRDKAKTEKRAMTADEAGKVDALLDEADALNAKADAEDRERDESAKAEARIADAEKRLASGRGARTTGRQPERVERVRLALEDDPKRGYGCGLEEEDRKNPLLGLGRYALDVAAAALPPGHHLRRATGEPSENFRKLAAMTQSSKPDGGVFTPPAFASAVWDGARVQSNSLLQFCDVFPMDGGTESVEFPAVDETSRANGSRWGGVRGYWKGESTDMSASESSGKFRGVKFEPQELFLWTKVSDKLLRNASALGNRLGVMAMDELNFKIGDGVINGTGTGQPKGVLAGVAGTDACRIEVAKETGQAAATIVRKNIDRMYGRCHANWRSGAAWFINQDCEQALQDLAVDVGTGGQPVYVPAGGYADAPHARLRGLPVIPIEYAATLGTIGDIMLLNLKAFGVAYRGLVDSSVSMHLYFNTADTAFRWIVEIDGQPWMKSAVTPFKGSNSLSPFVVLATRA